MEGPFNSIQETPEKLLELSKVSKLIWEANKKDGIHIVWRTDIWHGYSNKTTKTIEIGKRPVPNAIKQAWGISNLSDEAARTYVFSHENMHFILWEAFDNQEEFPEMKNLLNTISNIRKHTNLGLSRLGNMNIYDIENRNTAHEEDCVELMNIYGINPENLKNYLTWLTNTDIEILKEQALFKLPSQEIADIVFKQVSMTVAKFLQKKGIVTEIL